MFDKVLFEFELRNMRSLAKPLTDCIKNAFRSRYPSLAQYILKIYKDKVYNKQNKEETKDSNMAIIAVSIKDKQLLESFVGENGKQCIKECEWEIVSTLAASYENEESSFECLDYVVKDCGCTIDEDCLNIAVAFENKKFVDLAFSKYKDNLCERQNGSRALWAALKGKQLGICDILLENKYGSLMELKGNIEYLYTKSKEMKWFELVEYLEKHCDFLPKEEKKEVCILF